MKKNTFKVTLVATFVLIAGYTVYISKKNVDLSALALDNVGALANENGRGSVDCCNNCFGGFCGTFYPAGSSTGISMYYKI